MMRLVDEFDGADIDAARRLADDQHLRIALDLAGHDDLLLVAAGEIGGLQPGVRRADVVFLDLLRRHPCAMASRSRKRAAAVFRIAVVAEDRVLVFLELQDQAHVVAVLRNMGEAELAQSAPDRPCRSACRAGRISPGRRLADAGDRFEQFGLAVAGDAGDADDLAGADVEGDIVDHGDAAAVLDGQVARPRA